MSLFDVLMGRQEQLNSANNSLADQALERADKLNSYKEKAVADLEANKKSIVGEFSQGGILDTAVATLASPITQLGEGLAAALEMHTDANETDPIKAAQTRLVAKNLREAFNKDEWVGINPDTGERTSSLHRRTLGNALVLGAQGSAAALQGVVGLGSIPTLGWAGQKAEEMGFRPKDGIAELEKFLTPEMRLVNKKVEGADGFENTIKEILNNPSAMPSGIIKSLPSMLFGGAIGKGLGLVGVGTGLGGAIGEGAMMAGSQAEGIREKTDDGRLSLKQALLSAGTGVMGAAVGFAGNKLAGAMRVGDIDEAIVSGALAKSPRGTVSNTLLSGAIEGGEEFLQSGGETILKNIALNKPYDEGLGNAAATGLMTGAPMGAFFGLAGGAKEGAARKIAEAEAAVTFDTAVVTNDTTAYLDPDSKNYNPSRAVSVLAKHAALDTTLDDVKTSNMEQASKIVKDLEGKLEDNRDDHKFRIATPEKQQERIFGLKTAIDGLDSADPASARQIAGLTSILDNFVAMAAEPPLTPRQRREAETDLSSLERDSKSAKAVYETYVEDARQKTTKVELKAQVDLANAPVTGATPENLAASQAAARKVVSYGMASDLNEATALELANNKNNAFNDDQRTYLRQFSDARIASNALMSLDAVHQTVNTGDANNEGIQTYRKTISQALAAGDQNGAGTSLSKLENFAKSHKGKFGLVVEAFKEVNGKRKFGQPLPEGIQIVKTERGNVPNAGWERATRKYTPEEMTVNGGVTITVGSNNLFNAIKAESVAVSAAARELNTAYNLTFPGKASNVVGSAPSVAPSVSGVVPGTSVVPASTGVVPPITPPVVAIAPATQDTTPVVLATTVPKVVTTPDSGTVSIAVDTADTTKGALSYTTKKADGTAGYTAMVSKTGILSTVEDINDSTKTEPVNTVWIPSNPKVAEQVQSLLVERASTTAKTEERKTIALNIKNIVEDDVTVSEMGAKTTPLNKSVIQVLGTATKSLRWGSEQDPHAKDLLSRPDALNTLINVVGNHGVTGVTGVLGSGGGSIVLDTNMGALRLGLGVEVKPPVSEHIVQPIKSGSINGFRYSLLPKADTSNITEADVETMSALLAKEGLKFDDAGTDNLGRVNGKLMVIDAGAVIKENAIKASVPATGTPLSSATTPSTSPTGIPAVASVVSTPPATPVTPAAKVDPVASKAEAVPDVLGDTANTRVDDPKDVLNLRKDASTFEYTNDQAVALRGLVAGMDEMAANTDAPSRWSLLNGKAGTGKTTIVENIVNAAVDRGRDVFVMAPTNKAVIVLKNKLGMVESLIKSFATLHKTIYGVPRKKGGVLTFEELKEDFASVSNTTFIIDESSMISDKEFGVLRKLTGKGNQFILLGDENQLEPVDSKNNPRIFDAVDSKIKFGPPGGDMRSWEHKLNEVRRQGLKSHILKYATYLAIHAKDALVGIPANGVYGDITITDFASATKKAIQDVATNPENTVVLVTLNSEKNAINAAARAVRYGDREDYKAGNYTGVTYPMQEGESIIGLINGPFIVNSQTMAMPKIVGDAKNGTPYVSTWLSGLSDKAKEKHKYGDLRNIRGTTYTVMVGGEKGLEEQTMLVLTGLPKAAPPEEFFNYTQVGDRRDYPHRSWLVTTPAYALTVHKSQGSQWDNVHVLINHTGNWSKYKVLYTAVTRAAKSVTFGVSTSVFPQARISMDAVVEDTNEYIESKGRIFKTSTQQVVPPIEEGSDSNTDNPPEWDGPSDDVVIDPSNEPPPREGYDLSEEEDNSREPPDHIQFAPDDAESVGPQGKKTFVVSPAPTEAIDPAIVTGSTVEAGTQTGMSAEEVTKADAETAYQKTNLVAKFLKQVVMGKGDKAARPLVKVKAFLSHLIAGNVKVAEFLGEDQPPLNEKQQNLLNVFQEATKAWSDKIQNTVKQGVNSEKNDPNYWYVNVMNWLVQPYKNDKGGTSYAVDENTVTAVSLAALDVLVSMDGDKDGNGKEAINKMLGRSVEADLPERAYEILGRGLRSNLVRNSAGQMASDALGFKDRSQDTPQNILPQLQWSLGATVEKLLLDLKYVERIVVTNDEITELLGLIADLEAENNPDRAGTGGVNTESSLDFSRTKHEFLVLKRDPVTNEVAPEVKRLIEATKGTGGILDKVFSVESTLQYPSFEMIERTQTTTDSGMQIPKVLQEAQDIHRARPTFVEQDIWNIVQQMGDSIEGFLGINTPDESNTQITQLQGKTSAMNGLKRELSRYKEYIGTILKDTAPKGIDQGIFFDYSIWVLYRVGIATNFINRQSSKIHRHGFYDEGQVSIVTLSNKDMVDNFMLRVGEGFGIATDKQDVYKSLPEIKALFTTDKNADKINAASETVRKALYENGKLTDAEKANLLEVGQIGKEKMQTMAALVAMAHYEQAKSKNLETFRTTIPADSDGVANGPILAHAMFGAAANAAALNRTLEKGGFFTKDSGAIQFNDWKSNPTNLDLYQSTMTTLVEVLANTITTMQMPWMNALHFFAGDFRTNGDLVGSITKAGRDEVKNPTTKMVYGAGISGIITGMSILFTGHVNDVFAKAALSNDPAQIAKAIEQVNVLLSIQHNPGKPLPKLVPANQDLMKLRLDKDQLASLKLAYKNSVGNAVESVVESNFADFIERRDAFTKTAELTYGIYNTIYQAERVALINRLMDQEAAVPGTGIPFLKSRTEGRQPIRDLTKKEEQQLVNMLKPMEPKAHTLYSKEEDNIDAGLKIGKSEMRLSENPVYKSEVTARNVKFNPFSKENSSWSVSGNAQQRVSKSPGVSLLPGMILSIDSYIMHMTQKLHDLLNVHDSAVTGLANVRKVTESLNKQTWHATLNYSPMMEMSDALGRTLSGLAQLVDSGVLSTASGVELETFITNFANQNEYPPGEALQTHLAEFKAMAALAERTKLESLANVVYVGQYAREGGSYKVTEEDQANVATKLAQVNGNLTAKEIQTINTLAVEGKFAVEMEEVNNKDKDAYEEAIGDLAITGFPNAQVMPELQSASIDWSLGNAVRAQASAVLGTMWADKKTLAVSALEVLGQSDAIGFIKMLSVRFDKNAVKPVASWGKLRAEGAKVYGNPELINLLESRPLMSLRQALDAVTMSLKKSGKDPEMLGFYQQFLEAAAQQKAFSSTLKVRYLTTSTPENLVPDVILKGMSGQYSPKIDGDTIYIMGTEFVGSDITPELLLHELIHAALGWSVIKGQDALIDDPDSKTKEALLTKQLESLREQALKFVKAEAVKQEAEEKKTGKPSAKTLADTWKYALSDVHEMLAYGMGNKEFQDTVLGAMEVSSGKGTFVTGLQAFVKALTDFWFAGKTKPQYETGIDMLLHSVGGLLESSNDRNVKDSLRKSMGMATPVNTYSTTDVFKALADSKLSKAFSSTLEGLLTNMVEALHGPFGSLKAALMQDTPDSPLDVLSIALSTGQAPYAFNALASAHNFSNQEAYVAEQIAATIQLAIDDKDGPTQAVRSELLKLYKEMKEKLKPKDFHTGNWSTATPAEVSAAQAQYDFIFKNATKDSKGNYTFLTNFAAMGLAHQGFNKILQVPTSKTDKLLLDMSPLAVLKRAFDKILEWFNGKLTNTKAGQNADEKITALVRQLVAIEIKNKNLLKESMAGAMFGAVDKGMEATTTAIRDRVIKVANSKFFKNSKKAPIRMLGSVTSMVAKDQVKYLVENLKKVQETYFAGIPGIASSLLTEYTGPEEAMQVLLQTGKHSEGVRKDIIVKTGKGLLGAFADEGKNLTDAAKRGITTVGLRTGAHILLDHFDMAGLEKLVNSNADLQSAITSFEGKLTKFPKKIRNYFKNQSEILGYHLATDEVVDEHLMRNAGNIANLYGTQAKGRLTAAETKEATDIIDALSSLYAIKHSKSVDRDELSKVMTIESARPKGNGVHLALLLHKQLEMDSKDNLFNGQEALMSKGFTPELYNPHVDIKSANEAEGAKLEALGYQREGRVSKDPSDTDAEDISLYTLRGGGMRNWVSGMTSLTGTRAAGTKHHSNKAIHKQKRMVASKRMAIQALFEERTNFDPATVPRRFMAPVMNPDGDAVSYAYLMQADTKDALLDRKNNFEEVLGAFAGNVYDKKNSPKHNRKVVEALKAEFDLSYGASPNAFMRVGPVSPNLELREIYRMLPESMKEDIREIWGNDGMMVRSNMLDITFGYRKLGLASVFEKEEAQRNIMEKMFGFFVESALNTYGAGMAVKTGDTKKYANYGKRAGIVIARGENVWQSLVQETKDIFVVRTGITFLGNVGSNFTLLWLHGVPLADMAKHHQVAWKGAEDYLKDSAELARLKLQLTPGYLQSGITDIQQAIREVEAAMKSNPTRELIERGLMPTIVEDLAEETDPNSFRSEMVRKMEKMTAKLNSHVVDAAKGVYMGKSTSLYKTMSHLTQMSDFVARYALYQHLTTRKENPLTMDEAVKKATDSFVNYDIPMHRKLQYADDMGVIMFTKYFLRIQRILVERTRENPGRVMSLLLLSNYFDWLPAATDSSWLNHLGNNPFRWGPVSYPMAIPEVMPIKIGMGIF